MLTIFQNFLRGEGPIYGLFIGLVFLYGIWLFLYSIVLLNLKSVENPPEILLEGVPFRFYRGKSRIKRRKRIPRYYILNKRGRHTATRFKKQGEGTVETKVKIVRTSIVKRKPKKKPKKPKKEKWAKLNPEEEEKDKLYNFSRKQGKFLGNSYLMYELQYGVDLSKFIDKMDPLKQVQIINTLSRPDVFRRSKKKKKLKCWANIC